MNDFLQKYVGKIKDFMIFFFNDLLRVKSTRVQMIYFNAFAWTVAHIYFGFILPLVRELSILYFNIHRLPYSAINLDSPYAATVLGSTDAAFMGTVVVYVASKWNSYKDGSSDSDTQDPSKPNA
jgi:hypothetical protein